MSDKRNKTDLHCRDLETIVYRTALQGGDHTVRGRTTDTDIEQVISSYVENDASTVPRGH